MFFFCQIQAVLECPQKKRKNTKPRQRFQQQKLALNNIVILNMNMTLQTNEAAFMFICILQIMQYSSSGWFHVDTLRKTLAREINLFSL